LEIVHLEDDETYEYWEDGKDEDFYYLNDKNSVEKITIPTSSGIAYTFDKKSNDYKNWTDMELEEA
jgi:hypothetical protein